MLATRIELKQLSTPLILRDVERAPLSLFMNGDGTMTRAREHGNDDHRKLRRKALSDKRDDNAKRRDVSQ